MNTYQLAYDQEAKQFDSQYIIALVDKQVHEQEFKDTISQASAIYAATIESTGGQKARSFAITLVRIGCVLVLVSLLLGFMVADYCCFGYSERTVLYCIFVLSFVIGCVLIGASIIKLRKLNSERNTRVKHDLQMFLDNENATKYLPRGVQFLAKYTTQECNDQKFKAVQPVIWIVFCENVAAIPHFMLPPFVQQAQIVQVPATVQYQYYTQEQPVQINNPPTGFTSNM
jgi:hypothetical protein